jgi:hypothetical protein
MILPISFFFGPKKDFVTSLFCDKVCVVIQLD